MTRTSKIRVALCSLAMAGLFAAPVFAAPAPSAFPACGGDHGKGDTDGKKDVKKPKDGNDKKPPAPPSPA
jgi:hypothetical protein